MTPISGPQDVGGECPSSTITLFVKCCCDMSCCWSACGLPSPPLDCLREVPNAQWYYDQENGYFRAIIVD